MFRLVPLIFLFVALLIVAAKSIAVAGEDERLAVFRLGKLLGVYGPGMSVVVPFTDRVVRVKVSEIAGWQSMSEIELRREIERVVSDRVV